MDDSSACAVPPVRQLPPYPISRHEAELHWEMARQEVRARIAALPSSSFERTMLEEDERFYATFPQARQAAINTWYAQEFPYAHWVRPSVTYEDISMGVINDLPKTHTPSSVHPPVSDFSTFTPAHALALSPSSHLEIPAHRPLTIIYDASTEVTERDLTSSTDYVSSDRARSPQGCGSNQQSPAPEIVPESGIIPEITKQESVLLALQVLAPARRTRSARNTRKVYAPPAYTPYKQVHPSTFFATPPESTSACVSIPAPPSLEQYTGDCKAAIAATEYLHTSERIHTVEKPPVSVLPSPSKQFEVDFSPIRSQPLSPCKTHILSRSRQHSNAPSRRSNSPPASSKQPTFPASRKRAKLLRDKDGKPVMACLFCRGRKIACGAPPQGSDDPTCNQCARRGLSCRYPTESRRGQRKKKTDFVNVQSKDISTLLDLYRNATKGGEPHHMHDDSESEWDGRDS